MWRETARVQLGRRSSENEFQGLVTQNVELFLEEQKCIDLYKSVEVMFHFALVLVSGAHLPHLLLRNKESGV